ncbi:MAG: ATPase domain-containing protein, partial [Alphaproteobacteria bacterium]|nr:ATPase domain-containing protein [Alphaproteobacteria bacterium]
MAKAQERYVCQSCGAVHRKWMGKCDACGEWNSMVQEVAPTATPKGLGRGKGHVIHLHGLSGEGEDAPRWQTGLGELDRTCGGGLVKGSAILVGGDPGIGKSTILLQAVANLANRGLKAVYISGEEAVGQIRMRAGRLGLTEAPLELG